MSLVARYQPAVVVVERASCRQAISTWTMTTGGETISDLSLLCLHRRHRSLLQYDLQE